MDRFFAGIERRALRLAELATGNRDDALELVQESMLKLVRRYATRPEDEWAALFHRILQHALRDWARRRRTRFQWLSWWSDRPRADSDGGPEPEFPAPAGERPDRLAAQRAAVAAVVQEIGRLPLRQQQAVLLRVWEGMDVAEAARAMGCSSGSVKTHFSRAMARLREVLEAHR